MCVRARLCSCHIRCSLAEESYRLHIRGVVYLQPRLPSCSHSHCVDGALLTSLPSVFLSVPPLLCPFSWPLSCPLSLPWPFSCIPLLSCPLPLHLVSNGLVTQVCSHLMGQTRAGQQLGLFGFGLSVGTFAEQTETIEVHSPELNVARTAVLDYFSSPAQEQLAKVVHARVFVHNCAMCAPCYMGRGS